MEGKISTELYVYVPPNTDEPLGCAFINKSERKIGVTQFYDNTHFTLLENLLIQLNNSSEECTFSANINFPNTDIKETIINLFNNLNIHYTEVELPAKSALSLNESDLKLLINKKVEYSGIMELPYGLVSLNLAIKKMNLIAEEEFHHQFDISEYSFGAFLKMDSAAMNCLNLFSHTNLSANTKKIIGVDSIFTLLDKTSNKMGKRLLKKWMKQPLTSIAEINGRLDIVQSFIKNDAMCIKVRKILSKVPDVQVLAAKLFKIKMGKKAAVTLSDCVKAGEVLIEVNNLREVLLGSSDFQSYTEQLTNLCKSSGKLLEIVNSSIVLNESKEYIVSPTFDEALQKIKDNMSHVYDDIIELKSKIESEIGCDKAIKMQDSKADVFNFQVNKKYHEALVNNRRYSIINSQKATVSFTCGELKSLGKEYRKLNEEYLEAQSSVSKKIIEVVSSYYLAIECASALISEIDVLCAFSIVTTTAPKPYVRPIIKEEGDIIIKGSRHPLLENNFNVNVIENDCTMKKSSSRLHIITGPNMGGKSTFIRQIGTIVLLAQIGCYVPASEACIPVIDSIIARVGASDNQLKGISTFMEEMLETSCMLSIASPKSLLLVDELGRGTSTSEGFGLAMAIAEHIATEIKAFCLYATHFHELTELPTLCAGCKNYFMSATISSGGLRMDYSIKEGVIDQSYGVHVAELLKLPKSVIDDAKRIENEYTKLDNMINK